MVMANPVELDVYGRADFAVEKKSWMKAIPKQGTQTTPAPTPGKRNTQAIFTPAPTQRDLDARRNPAQLEQPVKLSLGSRMTGHNPEG
jgi:hypothetical protein